METGDGNGDDFMALFQRVSQGLGQYAEAVRKWMPRAGDEGGDGSVSEGVPPVVCDQLG
jgi:hypothetical protein